ncbi:MAG: hypothetical protein JWQ52_936, partial [Phenylobacterium sp.]|nr:hypothetical protein [Phenylobacterium sp.]
MHDHLFSPRTYRLRVGLPALLASAACAALWASPGLAQPAAAAAASAA